MYLKTAIVAITAFGLFMLGLGVLFLPEESQVAYSPPNIPDTRTIGVIERDPPSFELPTEPTSAGIPSESAIESPNALENSTPLFLSIIRELSPTFEEWLIPEEQIRKWVLLVDHIADKRVTKKYLPVNKPLDGFSARPIANGYAVDEETYERIEPMIAAMATIEPKTAVRYYQAWAHLFEEAFQELGKPGTFEERLQLAIENVIAVPPQIVLAKLKKPQVMYEYQDESLENASDLSKLIWRLGPDNQFTVQNYLYEVKFLLKR